MPPVELYENDKWPLFLRGWPIQAKVEAGKVMAKYRIGSGVVSRTSYTSGGTPQISFQQPDGAWTPPAIIPHAPQALPHHMTMPPQARQVAPIPAPRAKPKKPVLPHRVDPRQFADIQLSQGERPRQSAAPRVPPVQPSPPLPHMAPPFDPRHRNYMAGLGRWLSQARLQEQLEKLEHPYSYAENNPVSLMDPSGLISREYYPGMGTGWTDGNGGVLWPRPNRPTPTSDADCCIDKRSKANIATALPSVQKMVICVVCFLNAKGAKTGFHAIVTSGSRTIKEQNDLYAQGRGRNKSGPIVTWARGGYSNHNFQAAVDITFFRGGVPIWEGPQYQWGKEAAAHCGMEWGGNWKKKDLPHFQYPGVNDSNWQKRMRDRTRRGLPIILPPGGAK